MEIVGDEVIETNETPQEVSNSAAILNTLIPDDIKPGDESAPQEPAGALVPASAVESLAGLLSLIGIVAEFKGYMRMAAVWNDEASRKLAAKLVPVFAKYSWGQRLLNLLDNGAGVEELALFPVAMGMITATIMAYQGDSEALKTKQAKDEELEPGKAYDVGSPLGSTFTTA